VLRKRLLYLTSDQLFAYLWQAGRLTPGPVFGADAAGLRAFGLWLADGEPAPACLLADLVEEEFQRQLMPHVGGRAGRQMRRRRLHQLYRDTPYRHASVQGRASGGRRDDRVLFCALTSPAIVNPWVAVLEQQRVPLEGIYSASLLSVTLIRKLALAQPHLLLVTQQAGGLRESYFEAGQLKFSRLLQTAGRDGMAAGIAGETEKTRQFLASIRLLERGDLLHTVILAPTAELDALRPLCRDRADIAYRFIALEAAAARLGLGRPAGADGAPRSAEPLLLTLLSRRAPASHYALPGPARFYLLWRLRRVLRVASAAVLVGAVLWLAVNIWATADASTKLAQLRQQTRADEARYQAQMATLAPLPEQAANMKAAVLLARMVEAQGPQPARMLEMLSAALELAPQIELLQLDWAVRTPGPQSSLLAGIPAAPAQTLRVEAEVALAPSDYRAVLEGVNRFSAELARQPGLSVEILQTPLDLRPSVKLSGQSGPTVQPGKAKLILNLSWKP
jgi:hypothetical protein